MVTEYKAWWQVPRHGGKVKNSVTGSKALWQEPRHGIAEQRQQNHLFQRQIMVPLNYRLQLTAPLPFAHWARSWSGALSWLKTVNNLECWRSNIYDVQTMMTATQAWRENQSWQTLWQIRWPTFLVSIPSLVLRARSKSFIVQIKIEILVKKNIRGAR